MLTQEEADRLLALPKKSTSSGNYDFPYIGEQLTLELASLDDKESFLLDVHRGRIRVTQCKYQNRYRTTEILARLDVSGPPHVNPDGTEIDCPHLHTYRAGHGDRWAIPAPADRFRNLEDLFACFEDFLEFCNVVEPPRVQKGLFVT